MNPNDPNNPQPSVSPQVPQTPVQPVSQAPVTVSQAAATPQPTPAASVNPPQAPTSTPAVTPNPPQTPPQLQNTPISPTMPPPPKKGFPKKIIVIIAIVLVLIFIGILAVTLSSNKGNGEPTTDNQVFAPSPTAQVGAKEHTTEDYPDFKGVTIEDKTVMFNKVDESFQIKYMGHIYHEQDTGIFEPREVFLDTADQFPWYGMLNTPDNLVGEPKLFSFKAPATYRSFIFIMKWDDDQGEKYEMYRFHDNQVTKLQDFRKDRSFYVPVLDNFSLGGNFVSINIFSCPTCFDEEPEILLYHIPSGESRNIGRVSYFAWGNDDNAYEYKEYKEGVDPSTIQLRKNEFFVESTDILNPNK